jgi:hypothetical protein
MSGTTVAAPQVELSKDTCGFQENRSLVFPVLIMELRSLRVKSKTEAMLIVSHANLPIELLDLSLPAETTFQIEIRIGFNLTLRINVDPVTCQSSAPLRGNSICVSG